MKSILVPIDFSRPAVNAARYAMHLCEIVHSNLFLVNIIPAGSSAPSFGRDPGPLYGNSAISETSKRQLESFAEELTMQDALMTVPKSFHPAISCLVREGNIKDVLARLVRENKIGLTIMASSAKDPLQYTDCPVLLIPPAYKFRSVRKIAMATSLSNPDLEVIHSMAGLASWFGADLVVTHITDSAHDSPADHRKAAGFLRDVTNNINYDRIYYRHIKNSDIDDGLHWLAENGEIDILVMVHHQKGWFSNIYSSSHTKRISRHNVLPLLVFPADKRFTF